MWKSGGRVFLGEETNRNQSSEVGTCLAYSRIYVSLYISTGK